MIYKIKVAGKWSAYSFDDYNEAKGYALLLQDDDHDREISLYRKKVYHKFIGSLIYTNRERDKFRNGMLRICSPTENLDFFRLIYGKTPDSEGYSEGGIIYRSAINSTNHANNSN